METYRTGPADDSAATYLIRLSFFLNAKHQVPIGLSSGPPHSHSWRLEVRFRARFQGSGSAPAVEFAQLDHAVRDVLRPYEGQYLNDLAPFNAAVPATENIACFLFGAVSQAVAGWGVTVLDVTLWEAPTKGITVRTPLQAHGASPTRTSRPEVAAATDRTGWRKPAGSTQ